MSITYCQCLDVDWGAKTVELMKLYEKDQTFSDNTNTNKSLRTSVCQLKDIKK